MANSTGSSGNGLLYFIIGAIVAGAAAFGIYYFTEGGGAKDKASLEISVSDDGIKIDGD
ncbi:hypothetical protein K1X12_05280 [Hyphomonas sp. WL0036]|uniref:hypothetical protein n=1 Tax=Hyphomonas sediminis TaxID=2866160 RepID=UPI001C7EA8B2|nr:hypothetical protein [Hyphomonas sediminis]MBY9066300.1 hypothetical protein [Hyphomonas sediminis]